MIDNTIIKSFGQWDVYREYIWCEKGSYQVYIYNFVDQGKDHWINQMRPKRWCNQLQFEDAMNYLLALHGH